MSKKIDRTGEVKRMGNGLFAKIIRYQSAHDMDVQFIDNGQIVYGIKYIRYQKGWVRCPLIFEHIDDYVAVTNPNTNPHFTFLIDAEDFHLVKDKQWSLTNGYVCLSIPPQTRLHRLIVEAKQKELVDHINGNPLDNRKQNLRICSSGENLRNRNAPTNNTSGYKGVSWYKNYEKWEAYININKKRTKLGYFDTAKEAAEAYNVAAVKLHGEFARLNNI